MGIGGGIAGNVIPDECVVTVNYRFAPSRSQDEALAHVREVFDGYELRVTDTAPGARPGLDSPAAAALAEVVARLTGRPPQAKQGWTDVARFTRARGPGRELRARATRRWRTPTTSRPRWRTSRRCFDALREWLTS